MLLVLSSIIQPPRAGSSAPIVDPYAAAGVAHWRAAGAAAEVVTCHDLAQPGWKLALDGEPTFVVAGKPVAAGDVEGIVTRIAHVTPLELPFIHADDRDYAASEMQAFLLALLTDLPCPVLNRAHPGCLNGPAWTAEQWTRGAARASVPFRPITRRAYAGGIAVVEPEPVERRVVHVVGDEVFGEGARALEKAAVAIAKAAGTTLLRVAFDVRAQPAVFLDADPWVDISDQAIAAAIHERLT